MKKTNPKVVGGFVVGAVVLAVVAVVVFGSGRFFEDRRTHVAFFPGSLQGLRVGAPVEMRGIQVGTVTDLWVEYDPETLEFTLPVIMQIDLSRVRQTTHDEETKSQARELIEKGFRAQLVAQSLVTGQQTIQFDFHPDTPVTMVETNIPFPQIPTIPSTFEELRGSLDEMADQAGVVLAQISDLLSPENRARVGLTLEHLRNLAKDLDENADNLQPLHISITETLAEYKALAGRADGILVKNREELGKAIVEFRKAQSKVSLASESIAKLVADNQKGIGDFTNTGLAEISNLAVDMQATAEQIRRVMEEMERDPARFFLGRPREVQVE